MTEEKAVAVSRFADPTATAEVQLPSAWDPDPNDSSRVIGTAWDCMCPGSPHEHDVATVRTDLGSGEINRCRAYGWQSTGMTYYDWEAANDAFIGLAVVSWSLERIDTNGKRRPVPISRQTASLLNEGTRMTLLDAINGGSERPAGGDA